jgi:hypothetical protein
MSDLEELIRLPREKDNQPLLYVLRAHIIGVRLHAAPSAAPTASVELLTNGSRTMEFRMASADDACRWVLEHLGWEVSLDE